MTQRPPVQQRLPRRALNPVTGSPVTDRIARLICASLLVLGLAWAGGVSAQGTVESTAEAARLQATLDDGARHARYWQGIWASGYGLATAFYLSEAERTDNRETRFDAHVTAIKTGLAFADVLISPPPHQRMRRAMDTDEQAPDLARARAAVATLAIQEQRRQSWRARIGPLLVNAAGGLAIGVSDDRPRDGWLNFASGMLVTEVRIRTEPRHASRHTSRYADRYASAPRNTLRVGDDQLVYDWQWWLAPGHAGLAVRF
ncbi:hypothetical protein K8B33_06535 [Alcanivorax sp. JB21]|uniref:hypothetical protein n=1 Tax=Alcanivorax limicola TaxID=2874102 RepID=UPI001CBBD9A5|nr:hypothetical protein [Alcanivorax limicola]MBZ2188744.1 hypothetical protein [Alcanivorax limicola]